MKRLSFIILLSFFVLLLSCSIIGPNNNDSEYPTTLIPNPAVELQKLRNEFNELNNYEICSSLNEYGFTESKICLDREILRVEISDEEKMINMAKASLIKNKKFTNVTDTSLLVVERSSGIRGCVLCDGSWVEHLR